MLADSGYTIPIANQDLPPSESLLQTFDNLQSLNIAIDDVFRRLAMRISEERGKIGNITQRIETTTKKITSIGSNQSRVCTIFSSAKYPESDDMISIDPSKDTIHGLVPPQVVVSDHDTNLLPPIKVHKHVISKEMRSTRPHNVDTSSTFFELSHVASSRGEQANTSETEGLGRLPQNLTSISSVLLFNSDVNPYKKYSSFNNLEGVSGIDRNKSSLELFSAPKTIAEGTELPAFTGLQFDYRPDLGIVPTFALPSSLPLAHVAADISFGGNFTSIAPSTNSFALPTLSFDGLPSNAPEVKSKDIASGVPTNYKDPIPPSTTSTISTTAAVPTSNIGAIPTTSVHSMPPTSVPVSNTLPSVTVPSSNATPDNTPALTTPAVQQSSGPPAPKLPSIPTGRGGLLDAIKKGVSLKSKDEGNGDNDGNGDSKSSTGNSGSGFMSALKAGLDRRAAIMSGKEVVDAPRPKQETHALAGLDTSLKDRLLTLRKANESDNESGSDWDD